MPVKNRLAELQPQLAAWRRHLHENPELLYDLDYTSDFVAQRLTEVGCDEVIRGLGRTGVVGIIRGREDSRGRMIGLRADMDALPIQETTGAAWASKTPGKMHACGHDGHTTMLLGAAQYLAETRNFDGTAVLIFQPAEEGGAGAKAMLDDGLLERWPVAEFYGMHNWPGVPVGQFAISPGPFFAAGDTFNIVIEGKGGHAAKPHESIDPVVVGAQLVGALQSVAARSADPLHSIVVSVTSFRSSSEAYNVIPQSVELRGTVRTLQQEARDMAPLRIKALAEATAAAFGATAKVRFDMGYPIMANHETETAFAAEAALAISGMPVLSPQPTMGSEDFAYFLEQRPGAYILIGNGDSAMVHNPNYDFNDEALPSGASWYVAMIENRMALA